MFSKDDVQSCSMYLPLVSHFILNLGKIPELQVSVWSLLKCGKKVTLNVILKLILPSNLKPLTFLTGEY